MPYGYLTAVTIRCLDDGTLLVTGGARGITYEILKAMVDQVEQVENDEAMEWAHRLMKEEGILAGISSGAAMAIAHRVSRQPEHKGKTIVAILPDTAERYLSTALFDGMWEELETVQ